MFLYNRQGLETEVAFLVMNRLNKDNLIVTIKPGMEFKLQEPFLLCRTATGETSLWMVQNFIIARNIGNMANEHIDYLSFSDCF